MDFLENVPLAPYTTFKIGGPAAWFCEAVTEAEVLEGLRFARERGLPVFAMGGGSNLLVSDEGFRGLVLRVGIRGVEQLVEADRLLLRVGAGEDWDELVSRSVAADAAGIECLAGIPGSVGGTPVQNVGAYGQEVSETVTGVRAVEILSGEAREFRAVECGFGYRQSVFNSAAKGRYIVTRVDFGLAIGGSPTLAYADLKRHFAGRAKPLSLAEIAEGVRMIRRGKGMFLLAGDPDTASAGSFFKNPVVDQERLAAIAGLMPSATTIPQYPAGAGRVKLAAAWLLEQAGFGRGFGEGRAGISSRHTLALVNRGGATAAEVMELSRRITEVVEARFGIRLEREPVWLGPFGP